MCNGSNNYAEHRIAARFVSSHVPIVFDHFDANGRRLHHARK
jgi:hypothetical protein